MRRVKLSFQIVVYFLAVFLLAASASADSPNPGSMSSLGPRPLYLVDDMDKSPLKDALQECAAGPFYPTDFSIGHRGAAMQFPEHTRESYIAAAQMGAGIVECDVTFTKDMELVCRHSQCDLHTTCLLYTSPSPRDPE